jgi:hypothetical protein
MITQPVLNPKGLNEFDDGGRMRSSPFYNRIIDVMVELVKFTLLTRDRAAYLVDRYSERVETAEAVSKRVNQNSQLCDARRRLGSLQPSPPGRTHRRDRAGDREYAATRRCGLGFEATGGVRLSRAT